jgi:streptogramin lyase
MSEKPPPAFFLPGCEPDKQEEEYARFAEEDAVEVPPLGKRLYSIVVRDDGDVWYATVGKTLTGRHTVRKGRGRTATESTQALDDPALVRGIFIDSTGDLCIVHTDGGARSSDA